MITKKSRLSSIFLSSTILFSSFAPALPALAAPEERAPIKIAADALRLASPGAGVKAAAARIKTVNGIKMSVAGNPIARPSSLLAEEHSTAVNFQMAPQSASVRSRLRSFVQKALWGKAAAASDGGCAFDASRCAGSSGYLATVKDAPAADLIPAGAMGIRHFPKGPDNLADNVVLDSPPTRPVVQEPPTKAAPSDAGEPTPAPVPSAGIFGSGEIVLKADPRDPAQIAASLRDLVIKRTGMADEELVTERVRPQPGIHAVYVRFYQRKAARNADGSMAKKADGSIDYIPVDGAELDFTVKIIDGKARILYPPTSSPISASINVDTTRKFTDAELQAAAQSKIAPSAGRTQSAVVDLGATIIYMRGAWHAVEVYRPADGQVMIAVDKATKDDFVWDARLGVRKGRGKHDPPSPTPAPTGGKPNSVNGWAETDGDRPDGVAVVTLQDLPDLAFQATDGSRSFETDAAGQIKASDGKPITAPVTVEIPLIGKYARINDQAGNPLKLTAVLKPGEPNTLEFAKDTTEQGLAQFNAYVTYLRELAYARAHGLDDPSLNEQITINVNMNQNCNAYYDPTDHSLNFFLGNDECINTSKPDVIMHETGHRIHFAIGGYAGFMVHVMGQINGGLSEGWGDTFAMFVRKPDPKIGLNPIIGGWFFKTRTPNWIRNAKNNYQYNPQDEVHAQAQAFDAILYEVGQEIFALEGVLGLEKLAQTIFPTMHANAGDIPAAIKEIWIAAIDAGGNNPWDAFFRKACAAHGVPLPPKRGGPGLADFVARTVAPLSSAASPLSSISVEGENTVEVLPEGTSNAAGQETQPQTAGAALDAKPHGARRIIKTTLVVSAGQFKRAQALKDFERAIQYRPGDYGELARAPIVTESRGLLGSKITIEIEGAEDSVNYVAEQLKRLSGAAHTPHQAAEGRGHGPSGGARVGIRADDFGASGKAIPAEVLESYRKLKAGHEGWRNILQTLRHGDYEAKEEIMKRRYPGMTQDQADELLSIKIKELGDQISELERRYPGLTGNQQSS